MGDIACLWLMLRSWIGGIPAAFWGVVAGSFFSLGGVVLANRSSARNLQTQLAHDRDMKARQREMALRKDVYLAAAEAISAGFAVVARFSNMNVSPEEITRAYEDKAPAIAKVQVIARVDTMQAVAKLTTALSAAYLRLFLHRMSVSEKKTTLDIVSQKLAGHQQRQQNMIELMTQENLSGRPDDNRWKAIQTNYESETRGADEAIKERSVVSTAFLEAQLILAEACTAELTALNELLPPAIAAVRRELDLPIDEEALRRVLDDGIRQQQQSLQTFLSELRSKVAES